MSLLAQHLFSKEAIQERRDFIRRYIDWLGTPEGQASTDDEKFKGDDTRALLERGRDIDHRKLSDPFTI
ncbi:MAG TPA: hypothetical protein VJU83_09645 [Burkholderiales bacterium]|nr:hypothetical protein [Burkholderiales bacterium]